jgi:hypothetical protein
MGMLAQLRLDSEIRAFMTEQQRDLLEIGGQVIFPVYAASGGLYSTYIIYTKLPSAQWPEHADLGRQDHNCPGVLAIELEAAWEWPKVKAHLTAMLTWGPMGTGTGTRE